MSMYQIYQIYQIYHDITRIIYEHQSDTVLKWIKMWEECIRTLPQFHTIPMTKFHFPTSKW